MIRITVALLFCCALVLGSCSKLNETLEGDLTQGQVASGAANGDVLLNGVYHSLEYTFTSHLFIFPLMELSTDEAIAPTRGQDWDDNGIWRDLHQHRWNSIHERLGTCFNRLSGTIYAATDLLRYPSTQMQQAEARFIRAWAMYLLLDMYNQVPYRDPGETLTEVAKVRMGVEALNYIIEEITDIKDFLLPSPVHRANKYAAIFLLMKCYLNKAVYENRVTPEFELTDMNRVIELADEIIASNAFQFADNYFDNFAPDNTVIGTENIFTHFNEPGISEDNLTWFAWAIPFHPKQGLYGLNGWTTLPDFYNKFEPADKRRGLAYKAAGSPPNPGNHINVGFLIGQQYDYQTGAPLTFQNGALIFTPAVENIETGLNMEVTGIRPIKYMPDWNNYFRPGNDFVFFRFPDVLLMKAEAIMRGGTPTHSGPYGNSPLGIVNSIRTHPSRGASALTSVTLEILLDERGRELWWESWRRQDLVRFKKFLLPFQGKNYTSDPKFLIYPIPAEQLAINPNLVQNPGY